MSLRTNTDYLTQSTAHQRDTSSQDGETSREYGLFARAVRGEEGSELIALGGTFHQNPSAEELQEETHDHPDLDPALDPKTEQNDLGEAPRSSSEPAAEQHDVPPSESQQDQRPVSYALDFLRRLERAPILKGTETLTPFNVRSDARNLNIIEIGEDNTYQGSSESLLENRPTLIRRQAGGQSFVVGSTTDQGIKKALQIANAYKAMGILHLLSIHPEYDTQKILTDFAKKYPIAAQAILRVALQTGLPVDTLATNEQACRAIIDFLFSYNFVPYLGHREVPATPPSPSSASRTSSPRSLSPRQPPHRTPSRSTPARSTKRTPRTFSRSTNKPYKGLLPWYQEIVDRNARKHALPEPKLIDGSGLHSFYSRLQRHRKQRK